MRRRAFLKESGTAAAGVALSGALGNGARAAAQGLEPNALVINPVPGFELSPYLYMQFMEPLGATDGSVEAAWDHLADQWRDDVVAVTKELGPPMMRWGGIFADFYRWREGVGPREARPWSTCCGPASSRTRSGPASSWTSVGGWVPITKPSFPASIGRK